MIPLRDDLPHRRFPVVTVALIAVNVAVFLVELFGGDVGMTSLVRNWGMTPHDVVYQPSLRHTATIITSMFLHGGFMHIIGNMLYLWIFGDNIEDAFGHVGFFFLYLLFGLAGAGLVILTGAHSSIPNIGASGAISGVLGAYLVLYPRARVLTLVPIVFFIRFIVIPASVLLVIWIVLQVLNAVLGAQSGVAWFAHVGGFGAGVIAGLIARVARPRPRLQWR